MTGALFLGWRYLAFHKLKSAILVASVALMMFLDLFPAGMYQIMIVFQEGLWFARSQEILQGTVWQVLTYFRSIGGILFIVGGAFVGLEQIIERRIGRKTMGFKADVEARKDKDLAEILSQVQPQDLIKYGLIPEFVGRLPVVATLHELDVAALVRILTEPRNALVKQYKKIFEFENVSLRFTDDALEAIAEKAVERKIGARGLRMIMEELMLDLMYSLPSQTNIKEVVISKDVVLNKTSPLVVMEKAG